MTTANNPFEIFLGIETDAKKPDFGLVLGLDLESATELEIKKAADEVIAKVRAQKPGDRNREWAWLIDNLGRAKDALVKKAQKRKRPAENKSINTPPAVSSKSKKPAKGSSTEADAKVGPYAPPSAPPRKKAQAGQSVKEPSGQKAKTKPAAKVEKPLSKPNVALPPAYKKKSTTKEKQSQQGDDHSEFTLEAPDQRDSFDSDTHFSTNSFASAVASNKIDPMSPVDDPTEYWSDFDVSQIDSYGMIATMAPVASTTGVQQAASRPTSPDTDSLPTTTKTYYGESYRKKSKVGLMIGGTLLAMLIVGGISYAIIFGFSGNKDKVAQAENADANEGNNSKTEGEKNADSESGTPAEKPTNQDDEGTSNTKDAEADDTKTTDSDSTKMDDGSSEPGNPKPDTPKPETPSPDSPSPGTPSPNTPETKNPDDSEMKKEPENVAAPKNSEIAELANLLTGIRSKLNERDFVEASRLLDKAKALPILPDHKVLLDRLVRVNDLYQKFWNKVVEGCGKLKALDEIKFSDTNIVKVVEASEDRVIYRALGQRFEKEPRQLQIGLAMKIAEKEMDIQSAEGRMIKGAVFAIDSINNPDRADEAKSIWEEAKLVGGETDELILFLDDSYDELLASVITKEKVPAEEDVEKAQERFREKYADDVKTAGRNQKAAFDFAKQLLQDVPGLDDPADRHANLVAAVYYASKNGDVELVMTALSDMNKWFSVDLDQETLNALTKMNKNRLKPDQKREITRTAFEYMDRAKAASKPELELSFAELALASAKGARDPKLVQTATREVQRVKAFMAQNKSNQ